MQEAVLTVNGAPASKSGSSRQSPLVVSAVHKWRNGFPVAGLMVVPDNTWAPYGSVNPVAKSVLLAVGAAVCALAAFRNPAAKMANAMKIRLRELLFPG